MQNQYHRMSQLAGDRRLCQLLNPLLNASATTSLLRRLLMSWVFGIGIPEKNAQSARIHRQYLQFCLRHIKSPGKPCANKELAEAYHACEGERPQFPHLFERRPDWLVVMWSAANVTVRPNSMQTKTLKSGWRTIRPIIVELLTAWPGSKLTNFLWKRKKLQMLSIWMEQ